MKVCVDRDKCIGIGMCEAVAPEVFAVLEDGTLDLKDERPGEEQRAAVEEAISVCPTSAISIAED